MVWREPCTRDSVCFLYVVPFICKMCAAVYSVTCSELLSLDPSVPAGPSLSSWRDAHCH